MIDLTNETLLSLSQAARRFPPYRAGRPVSPSTVCRWITDGVKLPGGQVVRLEGTRMGGRWLTSVEALTRFAEAQTPAVGNGQAALRTDRQRNGAAARAGEALDAIGI